MALHCIPFLSDLHALTRRTLPALLVLLVAVSALPSLGEERLAWSPDPPPAGSLALLRGSSLSVYPLDLDLPASDVARDNAFAGPVTWSSDSRSLFFSRRIGARIEIVVSDLSDRSPASLAPHQGSNWSPVSAGDDSLLFLSDRDASCDLYLLALSDRSVRRLTRDENLETLLCAAPKVRRCAYLSTSPIGEDTVFLASLDNPFPAALPGPWKNVTELALSPDGLYLAVAADDALYLCELEPRAFPLFFRTAPLSPRITSLPPGRSVTFSADGRYLASLEDGSVVVRPVRSPSDASRLLESPLPRTALTFSSVRRDLACLAHAPRVPDAAVALLDSSGRRRWLARSQEEIEVAARVALAEGTLDEVRDLLPRLTSPPPAASAPSRPDPSRIDLLEALGHYDDAIHYALSFPSPNYASAGRIALLHSRSPSRALPWLSSSPDLDSQAFAEAIRKAPPPVLTRLIQAENALREGRSSDALPPIRFAVANAPHLLWTARLALAQALSSDLSSEALAKEEALANEADLAELLRASPDSPLRDRILLALGHLAAARRDPDSACERFADALRATLPQSRDLRASRFRLAAFDLAPIASLSHLETLLAALVEGPPATPALEDTVAFVVEILDSVGRPELANDFLARFAATFPLRPSNLLGLLRTLDLLNPSLRFREGAADLAPWRRARLEILASLPANEAAAAPLKRLFSILLGPSPLPATLPAADLLSSPSPSPTMAALCELLEADRALDAGDASSALAHLASCALLCGQSDFVRASSFASELIVEDPESKALSSVEGLSRRAVLAWLAWERNCSSGPWGALFCRLALLPPLPSASLREDCLPFARAALLRARSPDETPDLLAGPFFEELLAYRRLSAETVFLPPPGPALLDPDPRARYVELQALRTFLRPATAGRLRGGFFFPEVFRLLVARLRADLRPWTAAREARELLDLLRLESPRSPNEPVILLALGRIFLEDLADEPRAYETLDRLTVDFPDSPEFAHASLLAARIEKRKAEDLAQRNAPSMTASQPAAATASQPSSWRSSASVLVRKALSRLASLVRSRPDHPEVAGGSLRVLEADCALLLGQLENDPVLVRLAFKSYVRVFSDFPDSPEVVDGSLLVRVYNSLADEELSRVVRLNPSLLSPALDKLDPWQKARAQRLFPELLPAEP